MKKLIAVLVIISNALIIRAQEAKMAGTIDRVRLLGSDQVINWTQSETELLLDLRGAETGKNGFAVEINFD